MATRSAQPTPASRTAALPGQGAGPHGLLCLGRGRAMARGLKPAVLTLRSRGGAGGSSLLPVLSLSKQMRWWFQREVSL